MQKKLNTIYVCTNCDAQFTKWTGRCLECSSWGTLKEEIETGKISKTGKTEVPMANVVDLDNIKSYMESKGRIKTEIDEVDRVLGGGFVPGSIILVSGEPGIGKSTILAQIADAVGRNEKKKVLYVSGEESASQVKERLNRLNCDLKNFSFINDTNVEKIISATVKLNPALLIIDSIQTVYSAQVEAEAGSVSQIRASAISFLEIAKEKNITVILIGHITKDGQVAGPKSLEHLVDTVIYLEAEAAHSYRLLRATKNRFGSVNEIGIFEMTGGGFKEIKNPAGIFIETTEVKINGSALTCILEGTRPFLVEIQSLATKTIFGYPQRKASGFDLNRLQVLTAVLTKRADMNLSNHDVIINIVGGFKVSDPALDLAVCLAIGSSLLNQTIDRQTIILGEVGLGGEVRNVSKLKERLTEAQKLGFQTAIIPNNDLNFSKMKLIKIKNLKEAIKILFK